jgi:hypothetical protein
MKRILMLLASLAATTAGFAFDIRDVTHDVSHSIDKVNVLPLSLDDAFQFRKTLIQINDPLVNKPSFDPMINFERARINLGAVNGFERRSRYGHYYKFFWRCSRRADVTVRFEYRQQNIGAFVQARETEYKGVKGSQLTEFDIIGDQYTQDGKISGWRVLLIENGKIVGLNQSFLWN